ncbi:MAG: PAS domain S-box protein [Alphaproteobacteria bacterium]|nr:PAS domain S-box protein [Alphaproteobacteria bacterium]
MQDPDIRRRDSIAIRLIVAIVGFSSFIAIFTTAVQLFVDYRQSIERIERDLAYVEAVNLAPLSKSLWDLAEETIQLQLDSLTSHPEIEYAAIRVDGRIVWRAGQKPDGDVIAVQYPLVHSSGVLDRNLGTIEIVAGLSNIYQQLFEKAIVILGTNLLKTLAVAAFMYFLFHMYFTRHLIALADYARRMDLLDIGNSFRFAGMRGEDQRADELGDIASAMDQMRTNLRESYDELAESEDNFRHLIEDSAQGYFIHEDRRPVFVNPALAEMFGYEGPAEVLRNSNVQELFAPRERQRLSGYYKARLKGEAAPGNYEVEGVRKDGAPIWLNVSTQMVTWQGRRLIGVMIVDVSERKQAERQIQDLNRDLERRVEERTAELRAAQADLLRQERMAVLGQLTATVSHELRNPLGVIRTSAFVAREDQKDDNPRVLRAFERIERSVVRCDRIIDELLDFTRISILDPEQTVIDVWLDETLSEQDLPAQVALNRDFGLPDIVVPFDRDRLRRAVINVFDNACQAMTGEAHLENVDPKNLVLSVATRKTNGRVEVIFADNGPGVPNDLQAHIFEPLFSTKGFGVGLGLPVVKQIMEQHQGGVEVESEEGRGTRVCLWLPHDNPKR